MKKLLAGVALGILVSNAAHADNKYAALDIGQSKFSDACNGLPSSWSCSNGATFLRGSVGYMFSDKFSAELSYGDFGTANRSGTPVAGNAQSLDTSASAVQLSAVGGVVMFDMFLLTGKLGLVRSFTTTNAVLPGGTSASYTASKPPWATE